MNRSPKHPAQGQKLTSWKEELMALSRKRRAVLKALTAEADLLIPAVFYRELWRGYVDLEREARALLAEVERLQAADGAAEQDFETAVQRALRHGEMSL